ncbi:MAG: SRPBCC family protein [Bacteroidota bacterium]
MKSFPFTMMFALLLGLGSFAFAGGNAPEKVSKKEVPREIGGLKPADYTDAPLRVVIERELAASPAELWRYLGNSKTLPLWLKQVKRVDLEKAVHAVNEQGATRVCRFGNTPLSEKIVYIAEERLFAYQAADNAMLSNHLGVIKIEPHGEGSRLTWYQFFDKGSSGMKSSMIKLMMPGMIKKGVKRLDKLARS